MNQKTVFDFKKTFLTLSLLLLCVYPNLSKLESKKEPAAGSIYRAAFTEGHTLFSLLQGNDALVKANFLGWADGYSWDRPLRPRKRKSGKSNLLPSFSDKYDLLFKKQNVLMTVNREVSSASINFTIDLEFRENRQKTIGGGIEFLLNNAILRNGQSVAAPVLLPNNSGWSWQASPEQRVTVKFPENVVRIHFERGQKNKIRAMLFSKFLQIGIKSIPIEVTLSHPMREPSSEELEAIDHGWLKNALPPEMSFIDLSELNHKPAGKYGYVTAKGEDLFFGNGSRARFYGVNVQGASIFIKDKAQIELQAQRLAKLGVNLVRLHHHDSATWVRKSLIAKGPTTQAINANALDSYHWWVKCLKDQGIYIWVDLQVGRPWREGDGIPGWETDLKPKSRNGMASGKGFIYLNKRMQDLSKEFNERFLLTKNPYTGVSLAEEPAVMTLMITNENDLSHHFGNLFLADKKTPYHRSLFIQKLKSYADKNGYFFKSALEKTWQPGPAKMLLNDIEAEFNDSMIDHLKSIGVKVPIVTTNFWGKSKLYSLPSLSLGDAIDSHSYSIENPLVANPTTTSNFINVLAAAQVRGLPYTVSEYNAGPKNIRWTSHTVPLMAAAHASFQEWDAIMLYGYSQDAFRAKKLSPWSSYLNPSSTGMIPAAALMYRENHIAAGRHEYTLDLGKRLLNDGISSDTSLAIRTLSEQHKLRVALPTDTELGWIDAPTGKAKHYIVIDPNKNYLTHSNNQVNSDTGEISRNWEQGLLTIDSGLSQGVIGDLSNKTIKLSQSSFELDQGNAAVFLTSLDQRAIASSRKILVSTAANIKERENDSSLDMLSELVTGKLSFKTLASKFMIQPLHARLAEDEEPKINGDLVEVHAGLATVSLSREANTHWYLLTAIN